MENTTSDMNKYISDAGMPRYQREVDIDSGVTAVQVRATKIVEMIQRPTVGEPTMGLVLEGPFCPRDVTVKWAACWAPEVGGYFVLNDSLDGLPTYESAEQFEGRYGRVPELSAVPDRTPTKEEALIAAGLRNLSKQDEPLHIGLWQGKSPQLVVRRKHQGEHLEISERVAEELIASGLSCEG